MSDRALVRRLLAGDEAAFEEFFASYFPRVYRFARARLGGDDDAAEDVAQATFVKAVAKLHTYRGEAALLTWLCTIGRREIAARAARAWRTAELSLADDRAEIRAVLDALATLADDDPEHELGRRDLSRRVRMTLDHLPPPYGDALTWKYLQGLSVEEIARRLDLGYKAAESLLTRARRAFREAFAGVAPAGPAPERRSDE